MEVHCDCTPNIPDSLLHSERWRDGGREVECDAFIDLQAIWDLTCERLSGGCHGESAPDWLHTTAPSPPAAPPPAAAAAAHMLSPQRWSYRRSRRHLLGPNISLTARLSAAAVL